MNSPRREGVLQSAPRVSFLEIEKTFGVVETRYTTTGYDDFALLNTNPAHAPAAWVIRATHPW